MGGMGGSGDGDGGGGGLGGGGSGVGGAGDGSGAKEMMGSRRLGWSRTAAVAGAAAAAAATAAGAAAAAVDFGGAVVGGGAHHRSVAAASGGAVWVGGGAAQLAGSAPACPADVRPPPLGSLVQQLQRGSLCLAAAGQRAARSLRQGRRLQLGTRRSAAWWEVARLHAADGTSAALRC